MTIQAKVIADSINAKTSKRIITFELEYPRFIHSELMTHRVFSRNSASSRAIPIKTMLDTITANPATPIHWGANQAGMQAKQELEQPNKVRVQSLWNEAMMQAVELSQRMSDEGAHKQIANRITEAFQHMKVVVTSTEWNNWYWLRDHKDAQPEIEELAKQMQVAADNSEPFILYNSELHVPYVTRHRDSSGVLQYVNDDISYISGIQALRISSSCCAQTSYRKNNTALDKAEDIYDRLINSKPTHASPTEHQAVCIEEPSFEIEGITHIDKCGKYWSNNFQGWIQHRALIGNNVMKG